MINMATVEIKAFVPARDFELSKRFYVKAHADNFIGQNIDSTG